MIPPFSQGKPKLKEGGNLLRIWVLGDGAGSNHSGLLQTFSCPLQGGYCYHSITDEETEGPKDEITGPEPQD